MRDIVGALLSFLCIVHCLLPVFVVSYGASLGIEELAEYIGAEWLHLALLVPIIVILFFSLPKSYLQHSDVKPIALAAIGVVSLISALFLGHELEASLTVLGSSLVISAHLLNRRINNSSALVEA